MVDGHYVLTKSHNVFNIEKSKRKRSGEINNTELWHMRLGHIDIKRLTKLVKDVVINYQTISCKDVNHSDESYSWLELIEISFRIMYTCLVIKILQILK